MMEVCVHCDLAIEKYSGMWEWFDVYGDRTCPPNTDTSEHETFKDWDKRVNPTGQ